MDVSYQNVPVYKLCRCSDQSLGCVFVIEFFYYSDIIFSACLLDNSTSAWHFQLSNILDS